MLTNLTFFVHISMSNSKNTHIGQVHKWRAEEENTCCCYRGRWCSWVLKIWQQTLHNGSIRTLCLPCKTMIYLWSHSSYNRVSLQKCTTWVTDKAEKTGCLLRGGWISRFLWNGDPRAIFRPLRFSAESVVVVGWKCIGFGLLSFSSAFGAAARRQKQQRCSCLPNPGDESAEKTSSRLWTFVEYSLPPRKK